jgi:hypothetical protein
MSKLSKKLILSVLTLVLTVVALGATTFAWFTLGNEATVGQISGQITSGDGLEVRIAQGQEGQVLNTDSNTYEFEPITGYDAWYTSLPSSVLQEFLGKKYNPAASKIDLKGVTSENGRDIKNLNGYEAEYGSFIEFDLEIRSQFETKVFLSDVNLTGEVVRWASDADFKLSTSEDIFAHDGEANLDDTNSVLVDPSTAARVSVASVSKTIVYQKPENPEDLNADPKVARNTITDSVHKPSIYGAHDYYFVKNGSSLVTPLEKAFKSGTPGLAYADPYTLVLPETVTEFDAVDDMDNDDAILELEDGNDGYYYGTVTVRIWIEGWDNEAYNSIFNLELFVGLSFAKKESNQ